MLKTYKVATKTQTELIPLIRENIEAIIREIAYPNVTSHNGGAKLDILQSI